MYESYTRQALPSKKYRELIGTAICVFNSTRLCDADSPWSYCHQYGIFTVWYDTA